MGEIADTLVRGYQLGAEDDDEAFELGFWDDEGPSPDDRFMLIHDDEEKAEVFGETEIECWAWACYGARAELVGGFPSLLPGWQIVPIPERPSQ